jgi:hypothetical protein
VGAQTIAVLCPGPSLPERWAKADYSKYDLIVGVNTAGHRFCVHWLAFADWHIIEPIRMGLVSKPLTGLLCKKGMSIASLEHAELSGSFERLGRRPESMSNEIDPKCGYTFANTLAWLQHTRPDCSITVYGFDCSPDFRDFAGQQGDHSQNRWFKELIWIHAAWCQNIQVDSNISPAVLEWLNSDQPDSALWGLIPTQ